MAKPTVTQVAEAIEKGLERPFHPAALYKLNRFQHAKAAAKEKYREIVEAERYTCDNIAAVIDKAERAARRVFGELAAPRDAAVYTSVDGASVIPMDDDAPVSLAEEIRTCPQYEWCDLDGGPDHSEVERKKCHRNLENWFRQRRVYYLRASYSEFQAESWESIALAFGDHDVQIRIGSSKPQTLPYKHIPGFEDQKTGKPNQQWHMLLTCAGAGGTIPERARDGDEWLTIQKTIERVRKPLRDFFRLPDDPFPYHKGIGYVFRPKIKRMQATPDPQVVYDHFSDEVEAATRKSNLSKKDIQRTDGRQTNS